MLKQKISSARPTRLAWRAHCPLRPLVFHEPVDNQSVSFALALFARHAVKDT
jgi:hypothetical protein